MPLKPLQIYLALVLALTLCGGVPTQAQGHHAPNHKGKHKHWGYKGDVAPEYWHSLDPAFRIAKDGKAQSPIDMFTYGMMASKKVSKPLFYYSNVMFNIENNGHTIQLNPLLMDGYKSMDIITLDGEYYYVQQAHLHSPSEHFLNGKPYPMELHIVHKDAAGNAAVVGLFIEEGATNTTLAEAFANLPNKSGIKKKLIKSINFKELLADNPIVYRYDGSLTTPPCSEGIKWNVFGKPIQMSKQQINAFKAIYNGNNRPLQPLNNREISKTE